MPLLGDKTLIQASVLRLSESETMDFAAPIILTASDFRFIETGQLLQSDIEAAAILLEPEAHNTAPAILAASSNHVILESAAFHVAGERGMPCGAKQDRNPTVS